MRKALQITHHYAIVVQRPQRLPHNARKAEIPDLDFALHPQHSIMMEHQVSRMPSQCRLVRTPINGAENVISRGKVTKGREDRACSGPSPITRMLLGFRSRCIIQCCSKTSSSRTSDLLDLTICLRTASLADTADPANRRFVQRKDIVVMHMIVTCSMKLRPLSSCHISDLTVYRDMDALRSRSRWKRIISYRS